MNYLSDNIKKLINTTSKFLLNNQVIAQSYPLSFDKNGIFRIKIKLLNRCPSNVSLMFKRLNHGLYLVKSHHGRIKVKEGQYWRVSLEGNISTLKNFTGVLPTHKGTPLLKNENTSNHTSIIDRFKKQAKHYLKNYPKLFQLIKTIKNFMFKESSLDLCFYEGVTFYISSHEKFCFLFCYDSGGIYDEYLNAEGIFYPPQVAGNYYADAYSAFVFAKQFHLTGDTVWLKASESAQSFLARVYPQYRPASIVWHHSDFKNAAILEILLDQNISSIRELNFLSFNLLEDRYEPTNVFALRLHWKTLANKYRVDNRYTDEILNDFKRIRSDQTLDGLFHDNIYTYPDAHDLTYHQYTCACLGLALEASFFEEGWTAFSRAAFFSLMFLGPNGEPAYTGRASNNIHQSSSAALTFAIAAKYCDDTALRDQYLSAIQKIINNLKNFQIESSGMLPTALNRNVSLRMGWNHCESPYNALVCFMFFKIQTILKVLGVNQISSVEIPLEENSVFIADDAGFASVSLDGCYVVIFSGCDSSYGWSEHRHITGLAGLALIGKKKYPSFCPCLDLSIPSNLPLNDLPIINNTYPFGRGSLIKHNSMHGVTLTVSYGTANLLRSYILFKDFLIVVSNISSPSSFFIDSPISWSVLDDKDWTFSENYNLINVSYRGDWLASVEAAYVEIDGIISTKRKLTKSPKTTNPRSFCRRINFAPKCRTKNLFTVTIVRFSKDTASFSILRNKDSFELNYVDKLSNKSNSIYFDSIFI